MNLKQRGFYGSNALWNYMMVNASLRSHIIHHDQSGLLCPFHKGKKGEEIISIIFLLGQIPCGLTWLLRPHRGLI
jgi:hypothetical protein